MKLGFFLRTHFFLQLILSNLIGSLVEGMATPLIVESFSYPNGSLIRQPHSPWAHSSGNEGELQINSDAILLLESNTEDVSIPLFPPGDTTASPDVLFAAFDLTVLELPSGAGNYFAHFRGSSSSSFRGRLFVIPSEDEATGGFDLGISSGSRLAMDAERFPGGIVGTVYRIVLAYHQSLAQTTIWVDPESELSESITNRDNPSVRTVNAFSFRQSLSQGNGIGRLRIDNLVIASTFDIVLERLSTAPPGDSPADSESETKPFVPSPRLQFWPSDIQSISEGDTELRLRLTLHPAEDQPVTVSLRTSGTATSGLDYHELPDSIVFDPDGAAELPIRVIDDSDLEDMEVLTLEFATSGDNERMDPGPLHFEILDNDRIGLLFSESFELSDGPLTPETAWETHSGHPGTTLVQEGALVLNDQSTEDLNVALPGHPYLPEEDLALHLGFDLTIISPPSGPGSYFAHFKGSGNRDFRGRIFVRADDESPERMQVGLQADSSGIPLFHATKLDQFIPYRVQVAYQLATNQAMLWINPATDPSLLVESEGLAQPAPIQAVAFRQTGSPNGGIGTLRIDNLNIGTTFESIQRTPPQLPELSIHANQNKINETEPTPALLTLTRTGDLVDSLTIPLSLEGDAQQREDFQILFDPESVTLPSGATSVELRIFPIDDLRHEGPERVLLSLKPGPGYRLGTPSQTRIEIRDNDPKPLVLPPILNINTTRISAPLVIGHHYRLQASRDLTDWKTTRDWRAETSALVEPLDEGTGSSRFFRLLLIPQP